jgi:hypothetical protein
MAFEPPILTPPSLAPLPLAPPPLAIEVAAPSPVAIGNIKALFLEGGMLPF